MVMAPAITRVHKLYRLRTVSNDTGKGISSHGIASVLVKHKLSLNSILQDSDHERRARDHAMNCLLLGLLRKSPSDSSLYVPTSISYQLRKYKSSDSCPKDLHETAFFADRLCRLKLDNPQLRGERYDEFKTRLIVNVLAVLNSRPLHIYQIHYILSSKRDFGSVPRMEVDMKNRISKYDVAHDPDGQKSFRKFIRTDLENSEVFRSTKPLMDWCCQAGLLFPDQDYWYRISQKGVAALNYHRKLQPLWYSDFGSDPDLSAGILLAQNAAMSSGYEINSSHLDQQERDALDELRPFVEIGRSGKLKAGLSLELDTDIPPEQRKNAEAHAKRILKKAGLGSLDLTSPSRQSVVDLEEAFMATAEEKVLRERVSFLTAIGLKSAPRREQFQIDFEWESCLRLLSVGFHADAYNGEFAGLCNLRIASDNPDVVIRNSLLSLVECKSKAEWGTKLKLGKQVTGAFAAYQDYAEAISADSALFLCESDELDEDRYMQQLYKTRSLGKLVIASYDTIDKFRDDSKLKSRFHDALASPESYDLEDRVFYD